MTAPITPAEAHTLAATRATALPTLGGVLYVSTPGDRQMRVVAQGVELTIYKNTAVGKTLPPIGRLELTVGRDMRRWFMPQRLGALRHQAMRKGRPGWKHLA